MSPFYVEGDIKASLGICNLRIQRVEIGSP